MESLTVFSSASYPPDLASQARSPGRSSESSERRGEVLPLAGKPTYSGPARARTWTLRLPVRAERVHIEKQVVVAEEVVLRVREVEEVRHFEDALTHERLRVDGPAHLAATQRVPGLSARPNHSEPSSRFRGTRA